MYLKEIEISGFKSFADKINMNLDDKITCIVGPNGSGKSNIVDAIRFVLGEQSIKSLRGDSLMSDVIFSGSKNRKPMHVANVSLLFDNHDHYLNIPYDLVSVKRRLYRTGDNEYYLNGEKCRLKDIIDLFLDSNIGRDSFNIIGQGDIANILSNSGTDRRIVIEEAAGILKYKKRREEAFRKLDKTTINLDRVNDIIGEIENRLNPLKDQSEKAKKYLEYKEKLESNEVSLLVEEITTMNIEYQEKKEQIKKLEQELILLNKQLNDPEIEEMKLKDINLSKEIQNLNALLVSLAKEKEEINIKRNVLKERQKYQTKDIKTQENIDYLKDKKLDLSQQIKLLEQDIELKNNQKKEYEKTLNSIIEDCNQKRFKQETLIKESNTKRKEILDLTNQIDILKNNINDNLYLSISVQRILDNPKLKGIHDALINILKTEEKYQKALDVLTLSTKNFLIAEDMEAIKEAIAYLKENKLGRATFLPINVIKPKLVDLETKEICENTDGFLGIVSDFLEYDKLYENIVLNQFGNIILCDKIENANILSKRIANKYRIVTLDGEIIHVGGSVTGGSLNTSKNNFSLKNKVQELELTLNLNKNTLITQEESIDKLNTEIQLLERKIFENRGVLLESIDSLNISKNNLATFSKQLSDISLELKNIEGEDLENDLDKEYYDKSLEYETLDKKIKNLLQQKDMLQKSILEKEGTIKENRLNYQKKEKDLQNYTISLNKLDFKLDQDLNILNTEYSLTYERAKEEFALEVELEKARKDVDLYKHLLKEIGMVNLDSIQEFEEVNNRYTYLTNERDDMLKAKDMLYSIIDEMDEVMQNDFLETFKQLQVEFSKVFKEMFKGGEASLELTNPDNVLETGVEIIASPPGKKLKTVSLLSGGEKTLTAISLLFAILNIRSVPFCVFDEVEAALDEVNVDRFGEYLKHYQNKTQFLLITHKKRTMEYAKTLYGITMQEYGVSKLVSVKLVDNEN